MIPSNNVLVDKIGEATTVRHSKDQINNQANMSEESIYWLSRAN